MNTHPFLLGDFRLLRRDVRLLLLRSEVPPDLPQRFRDGWDRGAWGEGGLHGAEPLPRKAKEGACKQSGSRVLRCQRGTLAAHGACEYSTDRSAERVEIGTHSAIATLARREVR